MLKAWCTYCPIIPGWFQVQNFELLEDGTFDREMKPKISVIVPIYNVGKFLEKCVSSLIIQTYDNLEIILVNDGSTDNSLAICRHFESIDSRVCVIDQQNKGLVGARKAGVIQSKGDYITYVDGDDWVEPCIYERFVDSVIDYGGML